MNAGLQVVSCMLVMVLLGTASRFNKQQGAHVGVNNLLQSVAFLLGVFLHNCSCALFLHKRQPCT